MQAVELFPWWLAVGVLLVAAIFIVKGYEKAIPALTLLGGFLLIFLGLALPAASEASATDMIVYLLNTPSSVVMVAVGVVVCFTGVIQMLESD